MATNPQYKVSYTAKQIDELLGKVNPLEERVDQLTKGEVVPGVDFVEDPSTPDSPEDLVPYIFVKEGRDITDNVIGLIENRINVGDQISNYVTDKAAQPEGLATLDAQGKIIIDQIPALVHDIIEGYVADDVDADNDGQLDGRKLFYKDAEKKIPIDSPDGTDEKAGQGESGKIYLDLATNTSYRWGGSAYIPLTDLDPIDLDGDRITGILPLSRGGTGAALSYEANAIISFSSNSNKLSSTATANGAFYATAANGSPKFGILPIAQGGTGATSAEGIFTNLGITASANAINHTKNVIGDIQAQINSKVNDFSSVINTSSLDHGVHSVRIITIKYSECNTENGVAFKVSLVSSHGNAMSWRFLEDVIVTLNYNKEKPDTPADISVNTFKSYSESTSTVYDGITRNYGDIFWIDDKNKKEAHIYCLMGQFAYTYLTPVKRLGKSSSGTIVQYKDSDPDTPLTIYSGDEGPRNWANNGNICTDITLQDYVKLSGDQTISGLKTFNAPTNIDLTEQITTKYKTANGGAIIFGKEAENSGTMIRLDQTDGTPRLRFRASSVAGAMVWEQPEQNASLYIDLGNSTGTGVNRIAFPQNAAGTVALISQVVAKSGDTMSGTLTTANDKQFNFTSGAGMRGNSNGQLILSSVSNGGVFIRTNGTSTTGGLKILSAAVVPEIANTMSLGQSDVKFTTGYFNSGVNIGSCTAVYNSADECLNFMFT